MSMCENGRAVPRKKRLPGLKLKAKVFQEASRLLDPLPPPQPLTPNVEVAQLQLKYVRKPSKDKKFVGNKSMKMPKKQRQMVLPNSGLDLVMLSFFSCHKTY